MHELGVTRNVVAIVDEAAKGRRVGRVTLKIGKLSGVVSDAVAFCFDARIATPADSSSRPRLCSLPVNAVRVG